MRAPRSSLVSRPLRRPAAARQFGRRVDRLVAYYSATGGRTDPGLIDWIRGLPKSLRDKLLDLGLVDAGIVGSTLALSEHVAEFRQSLEAKGTSARQVSDVVKRASAVIEGCRFKTWQDVSAERVSSFLHQLRQGGKKVRGIGAQTSNHYLGAIRQFCKWMVRSGRAGSSPLEVLEKLNVETDLRHERRALSVEQAHGLLAAARVGAVIQGRRLGGHEPVWRMTGADRELLYRLAMETALRAGEIRSLTRSSFHLDVVPPMISLRARDAKNRRRGNNVPLRLDLVEDLRARLAALGADEPLFSLPPRAHMAEMIRRDLEAAGVPYRDEEGRVPDFHALRHTCATWLAEADVAPKRAQSILRHSTIGQTMNRYTHGSLALDAEAVARLPDLRVAQA